MNMMVSLEPAIPCGFYPSQFNFRMQIEALVECLIDVLDAIDVLDGFEMDGDEFDGSLSEDDFHVANNPSGGPGCPLADPDVAVDDEPCDDRNDDREEESFVVPEYRSDQSQPLPFDPYADSRIMRPHTSRIRADLRARQIRRAA